MLLFNFYAFLFCCCSVRVNALKQIPANLRAHLRNSTTLAQFHQKVKLKGQPFPTGGGNSLPIASAGNGKGSKANTFAAQHSANRARIEIIEEPIQSQDSCKVVNVCAGLNLQKDPNVFYFPECIDMPQCLGGCCDNSHNCHPVEFEVVKVKVNAYKYEGYQNGQEVFAPHEQLLVNMQRHKRCGCEQCLEKPTCDDSHQLIGCRCLCMNHHESLHCSGRRYWSDDTCRCECARQWCPDGELFSETECKCVRNSG